MTDPGGVAIRLAGRVSPSLQADLAWRKYRRNGDLTLLSVDRLVQQGDVAIDIGASRGLFMTRLSRLVGHRGEVHAFEPNPAHGEHLAAIARRRRNVIVHPVGLSNEAGTAKLHVPVLDSQEITGMASVSPPSTWSGATFVEVPVTLRRLDDELPAGRPVAFVKCDVEGHEAAVLAGAAETLRRSLPHLLIEIEQRHQDTSICDVFKRLAVLGYAGLALRSTTFMPLDDFDLERDQLRFVEGETLQEAMDPAYIHNFLFVRPEELDRVQALLRTAERAE